MKIRFRYFLYSDKNNNIVLLDRIKGIILYKTWGFQSMYNFILKNKIPYRDIKLRNFTYFDLFYHFVDESSLNPNINRGDRI